MRERRKYLLLLGAIAALLIGAVLLAVPGSPVYKKPTLGLDLQGGIEVVLRAVPERNAGGQITPAGMQTAQNIMTNRVNKIGVASPNVAVQGGNEIVDPARGRPRPGEGRGGHRQTGQLQFFDFETRPRAADRQRHRSAGASAVALRPAQGGQDPGEEGHAGGVLPLQDAIKKKVTTKVKGKKVTKQKTTDHTARAGAGQNLQQLLLPYNGKQPPRTEDPGGPAERTRRSGASGVGSCLGAGTNGTRRLARTGTSSSIRTARRELTGNDLVESGIAADLDPNTASRS